ncbi:ComF family protein [Flaviaesturariibacter aridisoli]|uniref:ComF family protein n=1 Tax=Flaviaesturariibacter aridisoli TaxID=2545761 RepID=A0A4R4DWJ4_9BACT|nr:phosphoribosyltransferase family protein [Flaviaesturariibacter aridisoli]TCZ65105.1 ComF family protein [Flaviaesturariibacter aridisoli]
MRFFHDLRDSLLHLAYPHLCAGCGHDALPTDTPLCLRCLASLPRTGFERHPYNPVDRLFWGRLPLFAATAQFYFTKDSIIQRLLHRVKYGGGQELATYLGRLMGGQLAAVPRFDTVDALLPLPLHRSREKARGYNQAELLCRGMAEAWERPLWTDAVHRNSATDTQTKKGRLERWQNMNGRFAVPDPDRLEGRHLLLVDDVVTTGATLEACGRALLSIPGVTLSIATLCIAAG